MKKAVTVLMVVLSVVWVYGYKTAYADKEYVNPREVEIVKAEDEVNLSPYFQITTDNAVDSLPLLKTDVKVNVAGVIANATLTQTYKNQGDKTIEAVYVFPLSTKSAIHAMRMKIADRITEAEINEKQRAQQIYNDAKNNGQTASLLQQQRPNVFQMNVANIMPGDIVEVTVEYTEALVPQSGVYEFVYPTVVGPRYAGETNKDDVKNNQWINTPYTHEGKNPSYAIDIDVTVNAGMPIADIWVKSHDVRISKDETSATVKLADNEKKGGNRDFILRYSLKGKEIQTGLLLYPGHDENYFLLMAQPPQRVGLEDLPSREYTFIVDVSGSMHGFPLNVSKSLIEKLLNNLREKDYFNIMFFAGGSKMLSEYPLQANETNINKAIAMLENQRGGGGTNILAALDKILSLEKKEGLSRTVVIATDGYVSVEKRTFDKIRKNLSDANVFAFGIGSSVNRYLIEGIARAGSGEAFVAINKSQAKVAAEKFFEYVKSPLLTDIKVKSQGFEIYDLEPKSFGDLYAQKPLIVYGKYKQAKGQIVISGNTVYGNYEQRIKVRRSDEDSKNSALSYLWAREKIARLSDYAQVGVNTEKEVTELGLRYSLMTKYTSFVAVDKVVRDTGEVVTVKQPLALPHGVSNLAVGNQIRKCVKTQSSPMALGGMACVDALSLTEAEEVKQYEPMYQRTEKDKEERDEKFKGHLSYQSLVQLVGGKYTQDITMADVDKAIEGIKGQLTKVLEDGGIKTITIELTVNNGKVTKVNIKSYTGKECKTADLEKILKTINLNRAAGNIEIQLKLK